MKNIPLSEKAVLNIKEIMQYTGFGENSVRNELNSPLCPFVIRRGNRIYANRRLLDKYLDSISGK